MIVNNFFEKVDFLGSKFHFYNGISLKKQTTIGGILTIILIIISIYLIYIFGANLITKSNPNITISIQNDSKYEYIDLKQENITFAFRIEDYNGNFINASNILYLKIYYYTSIPSEDGKYRSKSYEEYLGYHICNDSDIINENLTKNYGILYCPEIGGKKFGGYWDNPYIYFFEFQIFFCKNGSNYSINNTCTSMETLRNFFNQDNPRIFSVYYPVVEFDPLSYNKPLKIHYKNYYYYLNHQTQKSDDFYLKKTILNDDKGLLLSKYKNISFWGIEQIISTYSFYSEKDLTTEGSSSRIYTLKLYNTVENNYYTRHYTKIQNVIAIVGSLFNLLLNFFFLITHFIGESLRKLDILNTFFQFEEHKDNYSINLINKNNSQIIFPIKNLTQSIITLKNDNKSKKKKKTVGFYHPKDNEDIFNKKEFQKEFKKKSSWSQKNCSNKFKYNFETIYKNSDQSNVDLFQPRKSVPSINLNFNNKNDNSSFYKSNLTLKNIFSENIKIYVFFCCNNKSKYNQYFNIKHSNLLQFYYIQLIQINRYLKIIQEYDFLKKAFLNSYQIKSLYFLRRINLTNKLERESIAENKNSPNAEKNVIEYFKTQLSLKTLSKLDKFLLLNLSENIKNKIM